MENASKALIMAGSILIAMMIVGALVFGYQNLSDLEQVKSDAERAEKASTYMKELEEYNRETLYGSEVLSLANFIDHYNKVYKEEEGYVKVKISVNIKTEITKEGSSGYYIQVGRNTIEQITKGIRENLEGDINEYEIKYYEPYKDIKKTVKDFSQMTNRKLADTLGVTYPDGTPEYDIEEIIRTSSSKNKKLLEEISKYKNLKSKYTQFKETKFERNKVEYDSLGRIIEMEFEEQEITI